MSTAPATTQPLARGARGFSACFLRLGVIAGIVPLALALCPASPGGDSEGRKNKPVINYREPRREFQTARKGRWSFEVEKELLDQAPAIAAKALNRLQANLEEAFRRLPKAAHPVLLELKWFVLYGPKARGGGLGNGLEYCGRNAPKFRPNLDDRFARCILVHSAENYAALSDLWALKAVLHELGHAHHKENWPEKQADIMGAWRNAVDKGLYRNVRDDQGRIRPKVYALANQLEYFAELTAIYFGRGDYAPFDRAGLKAYDPVGYAMIEKMWGLSKDAPPPASIHSSGASPVTRKAMTTSTSR